METLFIMTEVVKTELFYIVYYFYDLARMLAPFWTAGIVLGSTISVFGKKRIYAAAAVLQHKKAGMFTLISAALLGIASPLCMYGTIPLAASFSQKGIKDDYLAAFMMSSVLLNPQLLIYTGALGAQLTTARFVICLAAGFCAGLLVRGYCARHSETPFFNFAGFAEPPSRDTHPNPAVRLIKNIGRNIRATSLWFVLGLLLTSLFQRYVPAEAFARFFGKHRGFGILSALSLGVPLYVCGGGTIPIIAAWLSNGMSSGAAAAFMVTGSATKFTNLGALKTVLGTKHFLYYVLYVIIFAYISGIFIDILI